MLVFVNHDDLRGQELMEELIRQGYYVTDEWSDLRFCQMIYLGMKGVDCKNHLFFPPAQTCLFTIIHNHPVIGKPFLLSLLKRFHQLLQLFQLIPGNFLPIVQG